jgi:choline-glycine betaine transporter
MNVSRYFWNGAEGVKIFIIGVVALVVLDIVLTGLSTTISIMSAIMLVVIPLLLIFVIPVVIGSAIIELGFIMEKKGLDLLKSRVKINE